MTKGVQLVKLEKHHSWWTTICIHMFFFLKSGYPPSMVYFRTPPGAVSRRGRVPTAGDLQPYNVTGGANIWVSDVSGQVGPWWFPKSWWYPHSWMVYWCLLYGKLYGKSPKKIGWQWWQPGVPPWQPGNLHDVWETNMDHHGDLGIETPDG